MSKWIIREFGKIHIFLCIHTHKPRAKITRYIYDGVYTYSIVLPWVGITLSKEA